MAAKDSSDRGFDPFNGECTHDGNFKHFASDIFSVSYLQASVKHSFGLKKCEDIIDFDFLDQGGNSFFLNKVNTQ